ncbi:MAG: hypothetical protein OEM26_18375 [Saprospiraceae bacterium]|nr:hypothetical protein [Saprospiraceae bacterium]
MRHHLFLLLTCTFLILACDGDSSSSGNCSISCGGFGTGQPFVQTNHPFVSEAECIQLGMERSGGCKASYCPPTGDPDDCYQVYP